MMQPETIQSILEANLEACQARVRGDGQHFEALIVSPIFEGKNKVRRHQAVYAALGDLMQEQVHALSMRTLTPEEWKNEKAKADNGANP